MRQNKREAMSDSSRSDHGLGSGAINLDLRYDSRSLMTAMDDLFLLSERQMAQISRISTIAWRGRVLMTGVSSAALSM